MTISSKNCPRCGNWNMACSRELEQIPPKEGESPLWAYWQVKWEIFECGMCNWEGGFLDRPSPWRVES